MLDNPNDFCEEVVYKVAEATSIKGSDKPTGWSADRPTTGWLNWDL